MHFIKIFNISTFFPSEELLDRRLNLNQED